MQHFRDNCSEQFSGAEVIGHNTIQYNWQVEYFWVKCSTWM